MLTLLFLGSVGLTEILVLLLIVLLIFGAKKIPELMKSFGKGVKSYSRADEELRQGGQELQGGGQRH